MFCLTGANVDDRDPKVWSILGKIIYGKLFADRGYINNFLMNLIAAISAYCFFDNKPEAIKGYCVEDNKQLTLF